MSSPKLIPYSRSRISVPFPDIPPDQWCDVRRDYEQGRTLKQLSEDYYCDRRTIRRCLLHNLNSTEIGRQQAPTKLTAFIHRIDILYEEYTCASRAASVLSGSSPVNATTAGADHHTSDKTAVKGSGICAISKLITAQIRDEGYTGSERTVRNYLSSRFYSIRKDPGRKDNHHDNH